MDANQIILQGTTSQQLVEDLKIAFKELLKDVTPQNDIDQGEQILTRDEVCSMLQFNKATLWKHTKKGKLKSYGIGRRVYYKKSEILNSLTPLKK